SPLTPDPSKWIKAPSIGVIVFVIVLVLVVSVKIAVNETVLPQGKLVGADNFRNTLCLATVAVASISESPDTRTATMAADSSIIVTTALELITD
ncbi:MAG: hypothetical protein QN720_08200, partial [Nitrososphaeraceae archaeon]|nr:hypothetical protein [Nitrososphaeraceae archaeon]MDW0332956.1 hypothetical protein [Nitrososphaeraceae archaeon]